MSRAPFDCPLCRVDGLSSTLRAVYDTSSYTRILVTDLEGGCDHAKGFGDLHRLTLEEVEILIDAALLAFARRTRRPRLRGTP